MVLELHGSVVQLPAALPDGGIDRQRTRGKNE
jgi:hypothetical protein